MLGSFLGAVMKRMLQTAALIAVPILIAISAEEAVGGNVVVGTGMPSSCNELALDTALGCYPSCSGGYTVTFDCGGPATITVTRTKSFSADTIIDGGGVIIISGGNAVSPFLVGHPEKFTVRNLTIANGGGAGFVNVEGILVRGAGIVNTGGTLVVSNSSFTGNSGGGIFNGSQSFASGSYYGGTVSITNSIFAGNGGGIVNVGGTVSITNSSFTDNSASGIDNRVHVGGGSHPATLTVTNSTFAGNSADLGGGILNWQGYTLTITNSTFAGNSAGVGGGIFSEGPLTITNSTFTGNRATGDSASTGGAIFFLGFGQDAATITNSTFTGNSAPSGPYDDNVGGIDGGSVTLTNTIVANSMGKNCRPGLTDGGHNLDDGTSCGFSTAKHSLGNTDPKLDPAGLQNNGGPTQTIALQAGSPAISAGDDTICAAAPVSNRDQRGFVRPGGDAANCSVGAYEYGALPHCAGDCDGDGRVTVDEILRMVNIALGTPNAAPCNPGDANQDDNVTVDEVITAVNNALSGCGG